MLDLLAFLALASCAALGWFRGLKGTALWILTLVAGSLAGALLARPVGRLLSQVAGGSLLVTVPLAGFVVAGVAAGVARAASRRVARERALRVQSGWEPPRWDRWTGAALGAAGGVGIVLVAGWVAHATAPLHGREADLRASVAGRAATRVGEPVIRAVAGEAVGNAVVAATAAYLMSDPEEARRTLGALVSDDRVRHLATDAGIRRELAGGDASALSRDPTVRALADDSGFVAAARRVRLLERAAAPTVLPQELASALTGELGPLVRTADALAQDPAVRAILSDTGFRDALARGDVAGLVASGDLDALLRKLTAELERGR